MILARPSRPKHEPALSRGEGSEVGDPEPIGC